MKTNFINNENLSVDHNNIYFDAFIRRMKENDILPESISFENGKSIDFDAYFNTFINKSIENNALPKTYPSDTKTTEYVDAYFDSFIKKSVENNFLPKLNFDEVSQKVNGGDIYFQVFTKNYIDKSGVQNDGSVERKMAKDCDAYFEKFTKVYANESVSSANTPLDITKLDGRNIYFDAFLKR